MKNLLVVLFASILLSFHIDNTKTTFKILNSNTNVEVISVNGKL